LTLNEKTKLLDLIYGVVDHNSGFLDHKTGVYDPKFGVIDHETGFKFT